MNQVKMSEQQREKMRLWLVYQLNRIWEDPSWMHEAIKVNLVDNITRAMLLLETYEEFPSDLHGQIEEALDVVLTGITFIMRGIENLDRAHHLTVALASEAQQRSNC